MSYASLLGECDGHQPVGKVINLSLLITKGFPENNFSVAHYSVRKFIKSFVKAQGWK